MTVKLRFACNEVVGNARPGEYTAPEGADIAQLMDLAAEENGSFTENYMDYLIFLVNDRKVQPEYVLHDGDRLTVLRMTFGG